jgi:hypothetical protein
MTSDDHPARVPTRRFSARVAAVLAADDPADFVTSKRDRLDVTFEGVPGDRHAGWTRAADARVPHYPRGTRIRNVRQVSLVSAEELAATAAALGLPEVRPEWLGANIVIEGLRLMSFLPAGTRLFFPGEAVLAAEGYNPPCVQPGRVIARATGQTTPQAFVRAAARRRGIMASVERPGAIVSGSKVTVVVPEQWIY